MHKPLQLVVPVPTHAAKRECLELLDSLREKVEAGTIETLFVIADRPDNFWLDFVAGRVPSRMQLIGQLEYIRTKMLHKFMREAEDL